MDRRTVTRRGALALIASGATLSVLRTEAFSLAEADRTLALDVASDSSALLSVEKIEDPDTVPELTNRTNYDMSVTLSSPDGGVEFDVDDDGSNEGSNPTFTIQGDGSQSRLVDVLADGTITVDFSAEILDFAGNTIGSIDFQRDVETRSQAGQIDVTPNVTATGNSGKYEFELENTGTIDATIVAIGIRETTNGNATGVSGGSIFTAEGTQVVTNPIPIDGSDPNSDTRRNFTQNVPLAQGQTKLFEFDKFQTANGKNAKMKGDEVDVTLYFDDGSSLEKRLVP